MEQEYLPFASGPYWLMLGILVFARGCDFGSTWLATPNLRLEANPLAAWLGWKRGILLNVALCAGLAAFLVPAVMLSTTSILVAARNLENAWLMRSMGETRYQVWMASMLQRSGTGLILGCFWSNGLLFFLVGLAVILSAGNIVSISIGFGIVGYAFAVVFFTTLSIWRSKRRFRYDPELDS
jgi:hypothetical protein